MRLLWLTVTLHCVAWHSLHSPLADAKLLSRESRPRIQGTRSPEGAPKSDRLVSESVKVDSERAFRAHAPNDQESTQLMKDIKDKCNGGESCNPYSEVSGGQDDDSLRVPPDSHQTYGHESRGRADEVQAPLDPGNKDEEFDVESARYWGL